VALKFISDTIDGTFDETIDRTIDGTTLRLRLDFFTRHGLQT
jgi:hypothetical protein